MEPNGYFWRAASSFDWETLLPIIFFVVYGIVQLLGAKKKSEEGEEAETDAAERARRIREEIRRKIAERKQASEGQPEPARPRPAAYDPTRPDGQAIPRTVPRPVHQPKPVVLEPEPVYQPNQTEIIQEQLRKERARLERAQREQAAAREKAKAMLAAVRIKGKAAQKAAVPQAGGQGGFRRELLTGLRGANGLRKAVLYREILGSPVGMRRG